MATALLWYCCTSHVAGVLISDAKKGGECVSVVWLNGGVYKVRKKCESPQFLFFLVFLVFVYSSCELSDPFCDSLFKLCRAIFTNLNLNLNLNLNFTFVFSLPLKNMYVREMNNVTIYRFLSLSPHILCVSLDS